MPTLTFTDGHDLQVGDLLGHTSRAAPLLVTDVDGPRVTLAVPDSREQYEAASQRAFWKLIGPEIEHPAFFRSQAVHPCQGSIDAGVPLVQHEWRGVLADYFDALEAADRIADDETQPEAIRDEARVLLMQAANVFAHLG